MLNIGQIKNISDLSQLLGVDVATLKRLTQDKGDIYDRAHHYPDHRKQYDLSHYELMRIPKKSNSLSFRTVYRVKNMTLSHVHKFLASYLRTIYRPPGSTHGYVPGRNIASNASVHLEKKIILAMDIENFFESISEVEIKDLFKKIGFKSNISTYLSKLVTLNGILVQGFNTSPILANMYVENMDKNLEFLCSMHNCNYTRYADDLTISSNSSLPPVSKITDQISGMNLSVNRAKTKIMRRGHKQYVTGLSVFDNLHPRIPRRHKKRIRLILFYLKKYGYRNHAIRQLGLMKYIFGEDSVRDYTVEIEIDHYISKLICKLKGWLDYANSVEPSFADSYRPIFNSLIQSSR